MIQTGVHMSEVRFYVWQGDDLPASVSAEYTTGNGGRAVGVVGKLPIKNGDVVSLDYGANRQVYTHSGRGYENQYKHGRMARFGGGAIELDAKTAVFIKSETATQEVFDSLVKKQKEESAPLIAQLVVQHEADVKIRFEQTVIQNKKNEEQRKQKVSSALDQMETFFAPKKPKI